VHGSVLPSQGNWVVHPYSSVARAVALSSGVVTPSTDIPSQLLVESLSAGTRACRARYVGPGAVRQSAAYMSRLDACRRSSVVAPLIARVRLAKPPLYDAVRGLEHPFVHHTSLVGAVASVTCLSIERAGEATASWHYLILPVSRAHFLTASVSTRGYGAGPLPVAGSRIRLRYLVDALTADLEQLGDLRGRHLSERERAGAPVLARPTQSPGQAGAPKEAKARRHSGNHPALCEAPTASWGATVTSSRRRTTARRTRRAALGGP